MTRRSTTRTLVGALVAVLFVVMGSSAANAQYGTTAPGTVTFTVEDSTVVAGQSLGVSGTGCDPDSEVTFTIGETVVGTATADSEGNYSGTVTIPALAPGTYTINAECGAEVLSLDITVGTGDGGTVPTTDDGLARTGFDLAPLAGIGAAAVVLGAAAVYGTRRKRQVV